MSPWKNLARRTPHPWPWLLAGLLVFGLGLALARAYLAEWQPAAAPAASLPLAFRQAAGRAGVELAPGPPRIELGSSLADIELPLAPLGRWEPGSLPGLGPELLLYVEQTGFLPPGGAARQLRIGFSPVTGQPAALSWQPDDLLEILEGGAGPRVAVEPFVPLLAGPGERLGPPRALFNSQGRSEVYPLLSLGPAPGGRPPQHLLAYPIQGTLGLHRLAGDTAWGAARVRQFRLGRVLLDFVPWLLGTGAVLILFIALAARRRIDLVNGAWLAALCLLTLIPGLLATPPRGFTAVLTVAGIGWRALWVFMVWSAGESLIRSTEPDFTTSLDALRVGRIGPRGARALLIGAGLGAALAGLQLALPALAVVLPGAWPEALSVRLPIFDDHANPVVAGIALAASVLVALAAAQRLLPPRWASWGALLAAPLLISPLRLHPGPLQALATLATLGLLVFTGRRFGLTALLVAAIASRLLPAACFAAFHAAWLPGTCAATAALSAAILGLGFLGLGRPPEVEMGRLAPRPFMRRLEEERRVRYEMDLLARMQKGLLPDRVPQPEGWDLAAVSRLATEAGGDLYDFLPDGDGHLWIAVGDVAGHGYSCSVVQAMTTAALTSVVGPGKAPAEVLHSVDRVIRRGGSRRNFTSLALLRLDPRTGKALFANAGHPYPLLVTGGEVQEIVLPGLPLGHGPRREYDDLALELPPGSVLLFCSDGLFEAADWRGNPYGFERPREVLRTVWRRPAAAIVEALLADWGRHLRAEEPPDDVTVLVIKRNLS